MTLSIHINIEDKWFYFMVLLFAIHDAGFMEPQWENTVYFCFQFKDH
jgi:hypothetical protein